MHPGTGEFAMKIHVIGRPCATDAARHAKPQDLSADLSRVPRALPPGLAAMPVDEIAALDRLIDRGFVSIVELLALIPPGADAVPESVFTAAEARAYWLANRGVLTRMYLERVRFVLNAMSEGINDELHYRGNATACERPWAASPPITTPQAASEELARRAPQLRGDLRRMSQDELGEHNEHWAVAQRCVRFLEALIPDRATEIPLGAFRTDGERGYRATHRGRFTRLCLRERSAECRGVRDAIAQAVGLRPLPLAPSFVTMLNAHELWLRDGDLGGGQRLAMRGFDARERQLVMRDLSRSVLERFSLRGAALIDTKLAQAQLTEISLRRATLFGVALTGAHLARCTLSDTELVADATDAKFEDCDFSGAKLKRGRWSRATFDRCSFRDAALIELSIDDATFTDCDFQGAIFSGDRAGWRGVRFVRCDLADAAWSAI